jgi:hypothetical protein
VVFKKLLSESEPSESWELLQLLLKQIHADHLVSGSTHASLVWATINVVKFRIDFVFGK